MKQIAFVGAADKTDLLLYIGKLMSSTGIKVLLVDGTKDKKMRYSIAPIEKDISITEFQGMEVTTSVPNYSELDSFLAIADGQGDLYDYVLIDTDSPDFFSYQEFKDVNHRFFVTTYERACIFQTEEIIAGIMATEEKPGYIEVDRIIIGSVECIIDEDYLNHQLNNHPIAWPQESYHLHLDEVDYAIKINNQHNHRVSLKGLSRNYLSLLKVVCKQVMECDDRTFKAALKEAQRKVS